MGRPRTPWEFRFWSRVQPVESGCWEWQGGRDRDGYGLFERTADIGRRAHRVAYYRFVGDIPVGYLVMHVCDNPACVRIDHLRCGLPVENTADMHHKGRFRSGYRNKTHCKRGHPFSGDNLGHQGNGHRRCRACARDASREYMRKYRRVFNDSKAVTANAVRSNEGNAND